MYTKVCLRHMSHAPSKVEKGEELKVIIRLVHTRIIGLSSHKLSYKLEYFFLEICCGEDDHSRYTGVPKAYKIL